MSNKINAENWTLYDKIRYGGLGYGSFCLPTDFFKVIVAIIFPPLGEVCNIVEDTVNFEFPYINLKSIKLLLRPENIRAIIYSFVLTTLFYIPGLIYTLTNIVNKERKIAYEGDPVFWREEDADRIKRQISQQTGEIDAEFKRVYKGSRVGSVGQYSEDIYKDSRDSAKDGYDDNRQYSEDKYREGRDSAKADYNDSTQYAADKYREARDGSKDIVFDIGNKASDLEFDNWDINIGSLF